MSPGALAAETGRQGLLEGRSEGIDSPSKRSILSWPTRPPRPRRSRWRGPREALALEGRIEPEDAPATALDVKQRVAARATT